MMMKVMCSFSMLTVMIVIIAMEMTGEKICRMNDALLPHSTSNKTKYDAYKQENSTYYFVCALLQRIPFLSFMMIRRGLLLKKYTFPIIWTTTKNCYCCFILIPAAWYTGYYSLKLIWLSKPRKSHWALEYKDQLFKFWWTGIPPEWFRREEMTYSQEKKP